DSKETIERAGVCVRRDTPSGTVPMLDESLASGIVSANSPHVIRSHGTDRQEFVRRREGGAGCSFPTGAIPVLNHLFSRNAKDAIGPDSPYVVRRDSCHAKKIVVW